MNTNIQKLLPLSAEQTEAALSKMTITQINEMLFEIIGELKQQENAKETAPLVCLTAMACVRLGQINQRGKDFEPNIFQR